jgi:hypothetical protein
MLDVAIEEWMAASPLYSLRTQRALNFGNGDVPTIFKNIQIDIGAPHQFMDFRYMVQDANHGEFWLDHCGALMDVEPMGEEFVHGMCHDIEDPTFDATAGATNPYAQVRPIHRPPRPWIAPHCHWRVGIDTESGTPVTPHRQWASSAIRDRGSASTIGADAEPAAGSTTRATSAPTSRSRPVTALLSRCKKGRADAPARLRVSLLRASRWGVDESPRTRRTCSPGPPV